MRARVMLSLEILQVRNGPLTMMTLLKFVLLYCIDCVKIGSLPAQRDVRLFPLFLHSGGGVPPQRCGSGVHEQRRPGLLLALHGAVQHPRPVKTQQDITIKPDKILSSTTTDCSCSLHWQAAQFSKAEVIVFLFVLQHDGWAISKIFTTFSS